MLRIPTKAISLCVVSLFIVSGATAVHAAYPDKPVSIVVAFAPGGMTDIVGRILATELSKRFDQTFVVENKPGAAGQVGTEYVARRANDGYTLLISATGHVIGPAVNKNVRYEPVKNFEPIAILARAPNLFVVNSSVPVKTMPELVEWMKKQPMVAYSSAGFGGSTHLGGELFKKTAQVPLEHVPYKGASPGTNAVASGEVPFAVQDSMSVSAFIKAERLRPIAVASEKPSALFPDLPTVAASGYPGYDVYTWLGLYAPAGTDSKIVGTLNSAANEIMNSPEMIERLKMQSSEAGGVMSPVEVRQFVQGEVDKWQKMVQITGVQVSN